MNNVFPALLMALIAGLCTGVGSAIALLTKSSDKRFTALTLGFSAGVMIYISLTEILTKAGAALSSSLSPALSSLWCSLSFFGGLCFIALIGKLVPSFEGDTAERSLKSCENADRPHLLRTGLFCALAIAVHNFPEGMATFISALRDIRVAAPLVVAIAIHNIPEGIAVAAPVYRATGSKKKAFTLSFLSGLAEPLGALLCWLILMPIMSDTVFGTVFAASAGIMVYISIDEILPAADEGGHHGLCVLGFVLGMAVMALSLLLFI